MKRIILKTAQECRLLAGHPWVFDNEVEHILGPDGPAHLEAGELVDVESARKTYIGRAFANPQSKIVGRIFSSSKEGVDKGFFKARLRNAIERRKEYYNLDEECERLVFAEADLLPGLIIDRFIGWPAVQAEPHILEKNNAGEPVSFKTLQAALGPAGIWLSVQFLSYAVDLRKTQILEALEELIGPVTGIIERDESPVRSLEGLPQFSGLIAGTYPEGGICIFENGLPFFADLMEGQKTGHFLDQRDNRRRAARYASGKRVLDMCCHSGGFAIHVARGDASSVLAADISPHALDSVVRNARLNGVEDRLSVEQGDLFDLLRNYERKKRDFDLIILDPPAFAKSHKSIEGAIRGYKEINLRALSLLKRGGILVTCSCSQAMTEGRFKAMVQDAAMDAEKRLHMLEFAYQAPDHPILVGYEESLYLKCGIYRVL
ncbi:MAG: class I SAM-dependent rRNA methyltransferase [Treponema sp.]|nr:class I SAM-dependent rRNA methyltransferase [Treponema sp.]